MIASGTTAGRGRWTVIVPAGRYVLGDPCYAVPTHLWGDLLSSCGIFGCDPDGGPVGTIDGFHVLGFGTAYGDGEFRGSDGHCYAVDAGLIGLVPLALAEQDTSNSWTIMSTVIELNENTVCTNDNGVMTFGDILIDTTNDFFEERNYFS